MIAYIIIYLLFFTIGITMGSFFTLATYRIPLKQDITHTRSYCPNCNHRLEFLDLIPVLSFIFLGGKCRYCKEKISPRYIIMELLSGLIYIFIILLLKIDFLNISTTEIIKLLYVTLLYGVCFIQVGIFAEKKQISLEVLIFGIIIQILYITYLYILKFNIYRYIIYLILMCILLLIKVIIKNRGNYENK